MNDGKMVFLIIVSFLAGIFLSWMISLIFKSKNQKQMALIIGAIKRFSKGDISQKISLAEVGQYQGLASVINQMAVVLKSEIHESDEERVKFTAILDNMIEGVIAVDAEKQVALINPAAAEIFKVDRKASLGASFIRVVQSTAVDEMMDSALMQSAAVTGEIEMTYPTQKILNAVVVGLKVPKGGIAAFLVIHDVTAMKKLENLRREFVANVSHELRTPLTSIRGFVETLLGGAIKDTDKAVSFLKIIEEDSMRLTRLINNLLELSKLESDQMPLQKSRVDLVSEADKTLEFLQPKIQEYGVSVKKNYATRNPIWVNADADKIRQVMMNLIDNAMKFGKDGKMIEIDLALDGNSSARFSVRDKGVGIPEHAVGRVFERFYRVDKARSREVGGTGLGLSIVKHIIEAHGGFVACESRLGQGSTFFFTLPV